MYFKFRFRAYRKMMIFQPSTPVKSPQLYGSFCEAYIEAICRDLFFIVTGPKGLFHILFQGGTFNQSKRLFFKLWLTPIFCSKHTIKLIITQCDSCVCPKDADTYFFQGNRRFSVSCTSPETRPISYFTWFGNRLRIVLIKIHPTFPVGLVFSTTK